MHARIISVSTKINQIPDWFTAIKLTWVAAGTNCWPESWKDLSLPLTINQSYGSAKFLTIEQAIQIWGACSFYAHLCPFLGENDMPIFKVVSAWKQMRRSLFFCYGGLCIRTIRTTVKREWALARSTCRFRSQWFGTVRPRWMLTALAAPVITTVSQGVNGHTSKPKQTEYLLTWIEHSLLKVFKIIESVLFRGACVLHEDEEKIVI